MFQKILTFVEACQQVLCCTNAKKQQKVVNTTATQYHEDVPSCHRLQDSAMGQIL